MHLDEDRRQALLRLLDALVDQKRARIIVEPKHAAPGFWFGGGNLVADEGGVLWLCGRYRNEGDSRTGLEAGTRGLECALFRSDDGGGTFDEARTWTKADLSAEGQDVLSIEGTSLHRLGDGSWELFVSTEKDRLYPEAYRDYQKPGTGVWSIDRIGGPDPEVLVTSSLEPVLATDRPGQLHVKDPVVFDLDQRTDMMFCTHPISWASSNTGLAVRPHEAAGFEVVSWQLVPRGPIWDVAATRVTDRLAVPRVGLFRDAPPGSVLFYDGAESMRQLDENPRAKKRPRGYSCEELGGAMWAPADDFGAAERISPVYARFVSPAGTGSSRYVSTLATAQGIWATWQQSQSDGSQPLVMNHLSMDEVERLLSEQ